MNSCSIAVAGLWHLGEIYSAGLAELGHRVIGISDDESLVRKLSAGEPPLPEPGLSELLKKNIAAGRLAYATDFSAIKNCDAFWLTFDTPVNEKDEVDLSVIWRTLEKAAPFLQSGSLIVVSSQVSAGTGAEIKKFLDKERPDLKWDYVYTPENLRLGEAVGCFLKPGRVVIGADTPAAKEKIEGIFASLKAEFISMSVSSAEMSKHALNVFLATCVSFGNEIADICEKTGADAKDVVRALRSDARVGPRLPLEPGLSFSGGTLARDVKTLMNLARKHDIAPSLVDRVWEKNESRKNLVETRLEDFLGGFSGRKIAILGLTYKPGTKTLRRSLAVETAVALARKGAVLSLSDPQAEEADMSPIAGSSFSRDIYAACGDAEAIVLMTPWPEFKNVDLQKLKESAKPGAVFFDPTNLFYDSEKEFREAGFRYAGVGRAVFEK